MSPENAAKAKKAIEEYDAAVLKATTDARLDPENVELAEAEERARANMPRVEYAFEDIKNITLGKPKADSVYRLQAAMMLAPGTYDAYLLAKEPAASLKNKRTPAKAGLLKVQLTVPDFSTGDLTTSELIVTNMVRGAQGSAVSGPARGEPVHLRHDCRDAVVHRPVREDR